MKKIILFSLLIFSFHGLCAMEAQERRDLLDSERQELLQFKYTEDEGVYSVEFSPDNKYVALTTKNKKIKIFNLASQEFKTYGGFDCAENSVVHWSPDSQKIALNCDDTIMIEDNDKVKKCLCRRTVNTSCWLPDSQRIAFGCGKKMKVFHIETGVIVKRCDVGGDLNFIDVAPDGERMALIVDGKVKIFDCNSSKICVQYNRNKTVRSVRWSPDSKKIALCFGKFGKIITIKDGHSEHSLFEAQVNVVDWSPDGKFIAFGLDDRIKIVDSGMQSLQGASLQGEKVNSVHWSSDSKKLAVGGDCHGVKIINSTSSFVEIQPLLVKCTLKNPTRSQACLFKRIQEKLLQKNADLEQNEYLKIGTIERKTLEEMPGMKRLFDIEKLESTVKGKREWQLRLKTEISLL